MLEILEAARLTKEQLDQLLLRPSQQDSEARQIAAEILTAIKEKGIPALQEYSRKFDKADLEPEDFLVSESEFETS